MLITIKRNAVVLMPQNGEWTKTSEMVKEIAAASGKKCASLKMLDPVVFLCSKAPGRIGRLVNKAFGNSCYTHELSAYIGINYQKISLVASIKKTE